MNPMNIYELGFALDEVTLFLDTHPDHAEALEHYCRLKQQYAQAVKDYEMTCAPLTIDRVHNDNDWKWVKTPWPWEGGCLCGTMKSDYSIQ